MQSLPVTFIHLKSHLVYLQGLEFRQLILTTLTVSNTQRNHPNTSRLHPRQTSDTTLLTLPITTNLTPSKPHRPTRDATTRTDTDTEPYEPAATSPNLVPTATTETVTAIARIGTAANDHGQQAEAEPAPDTDAPRKPVSDDAPVPAVTTIAYHDNQRTARNHAHDTNKHATGCAATETTDDPVAEPRQCIRSKT